MSVAEDYYSHWDEKFSTRDWGKYPPEDLVRFIGRNYKSAPRSETAILEVGCGPGANIWFLHREGYRVAGIDGSPAAIEKAGLRIISENGHLGHSAPDLRVGNFCKLPWPDNAFDAVIDIFAVYANTTPVISETIAEVNRVLKPGGRLYAKLWGTKTTGFGTGVEIEPHTFDDIPIGPCHNMGVSHFFDAAEVRERYAAFQIDAIDTINRSDTIIDSHIEELLCQFTKKPAGEQ